MTTEHHSFELGQGGVSNPRRDSSLNDLARPGRASRKVLDEITRNALLTLLRARMDEEWFGLSFPQKCDDGHAYADTDFTKLRATMDS